MKKRYWLLLILSSLPICGFVFGGFYFLQQRLPQLNQFSDTRRVDQSLTPQVSLRQCRASLIYEQRLTTIQNRETIISRLPENWRNGSGVFASYYNQIRYEQDYGEQVKLRSWIHHGHFLEKENIVLVRNSVTIDLC